jgi:cell division protease FtsH
MVAIILRAMGGRAAEELVFDHFSTGASNDLQQATSLARDMTCQYGMNDRIGPVSYGEEGGDVFLGRDLATRKSYSEDTARLIDEEVSSLLNGLYDQAKALLAENREVLETVTAALLERETLETSDLERLLAGEELAPMPPPTAEAPADDPADGTVNPASPDQPDELPDGKLPDPEPMPG